MFLSFIYLSELGDDYRYDKWRRSRPLDGAPNSNDQFEFETMGTKGVTNLLDTYLSVVPDFKAWAVEEPMQGGLTLVMLKGMGG